MTDGGAQAPPDNGGAPEPDISGGFLGVPEFSPAAADAKPDIEDISPSVTDMTWNPAARHRAGVQAQLARRLIWVLVVVLFLGAALLSTTHWTAITAQDVSDFFGIAFGAVVTLATAATSFWFGSQGGESRHGGESRQTRPPSS